MTFALGKVKPGSTFVQGGGPIGVGRLVGKTRRARGDFGSESVPAKTSGELGLKRGQSGEVDMSRWSTARRAGGGRRVFECPFRSRVEMRKLPRVRGRIVVVRCSPNRPRSTVPVSSGANCVCCGARVTIRRLRGGDPADGFRAACLSSASSQTSPLDRVQAGFREMERGGDVMRFS